MNFNNVFENKNILSLERDKCAKFLREYLELIFKYKIQPNTTEVEGLKVLHNLFPWSMQSKQK